MPTGGVPTGGVIGEGGSAGANAAGGRAGSAGAAARGGTATGGTATGGTATGGAATGGSPTGGAATGGTAAGGGATGGAAGRVGTTGGAAGAFSPCPAAGTDCAIMPLGDSITDGYNADTPGGYRIELFVKTQLAGQHVTFVGRNSNGPASVKVGATMVPFPQHHEGYSGYTIDPLGGRQGVSPLTDGALSTGKPHIVLLHIGTNDLDLNLDVAQAPTRLGALLDKITNDSPQALLVVAKIIPTGNDESNARIRAYDDAIPALVQSRVNAGKHIVLVDMYAPFAANASFKTALLEDRWHPNASGYALMAGVWYDAIKAHLH